MEETFARLLIDSSKIARLWQQALADTGFAPLPVPDIRAQLKSLFERSVRCLSCDTIDATEARAIGRSVATLHYLHPNVLNVTHNLFAETFLQYGISSDQYLLFARLIRFLGQFSAGFFEQARQSVLSEQEDIKAAALIERDNAYEELRAVLDSAVDAMVLISPERRAEMVNRQFTVQFGLDSADVVGKRFDELWPVVAPIYAEPQLLAHHIARAAQSNEPITQELVQARPHARILQIYSVPVQTARGRKLGILHAFRDITRERELDRREREFLAEVTHELRTPLTSIKGYADLLIAEEVSVEEQRECLEIIQRNTARMASLVNDLIDLSQLELGQVRFQLSYVEIPTLIRRVAESLRLQFREKQQELSLSLPDDLLPVWGDLGRLTQVFTNLLVNAHRYTPVGGKIAINAGQDGDRVRVQIIDNGIGISAKDQVHLFTKFFRVRSKATANIQGSGLGLVITRSLVEQLGGTITLESVLGVGSTFTVTLPTSPLESIPQPSPSPVANYD